MIFRNVQSFFILTRSLSQVAKQHLNSDLIINSLKAKHEGITVLSLNRQNKKNAMGASLLSLIHQAIDKLYYEQETRVLILNSLVQGVFCAGADLKERIGMNTEEVEIFVNSFRNLVSKIYNAPFPTIAAIDGVALGGGLELALACDIRVASNNAKLGLVETRLAIIPGAGGTQLLPRIIGVAKAKELIFRAKVVDGLEAETIGLVNSVINQNEDQNAAFCKSLNIAEDILPNGPIAVKLAKKAINKGIEVDINTGFSIEDSCYARILPTKDRLEGLQAFKEKRKALFKGH